MTRQECEDYLLSLGFEKGNPDEGQADFFYAYPNDDEVLIFEEDDVWHLQFYVGGQGGGKDRTFGTLSNLINFMDAE